RSDRMPDETVALVIAGNTLELYAGNRDRVVPALVMPPRGPAPAARHAAQISEPVLRATASSLGSDLDYVTRAAAHDKDAPARQIREPVVLSLDAIALFRRASKRAYGQIEIRAAGRHALISVGDVTIESWREIEDHDMPPLDRVWPREDAALARVRIPVQEL